MYAVIQSGGKQYRVSPGQTVRVEKLQGEVGSEVKLDPVLLFAQNEEIQIGQPSLSDVSVSGHIVEQGKAKKIIVFKMKRRKRYRRKQGHRQLFTAIKIDSIENNIGNVENNIDDMEAKVDSIENKVETTENRVETTEAQVETTEAKVETTEAQVETTEAQVETTESIVETTEAKVETTEANVETTEANVETTETTETTKEKE